MRLFYFLFIFLLSLNFAAFSIQSKAVNIENKFYKTSFISSRIPLKHTANLKQEDQTLQQDVNISPTVKSFSVFFVTLFSFAFFGLGHKNTFIKVATRNIRYHYGCIFKMLYPKHVFW